MEAKELRQFGVDELNGRIRQWREELFRSRFKGQTSETKDTSIYRKLKRDIARSLTVLNEKMQALDSASSNSLLAEQSVSKNKLIKGSKSELMSPKESIQAKNKKKKKAE